MEGARPPSRSQLLRLEFPLAAVGPDGKILRANRAELDMLGYRREEYVGRHIAEFHADEDIIMRKPL